MSIESGTLEGRWLGGVHPETYTQITFPGEGLCHGRFKCPSGQHGELEGILMDGGKRIRGHYFDPCGAHGGSNKKNNTFDMRLDSGLRSWECMVFANGDEIGKWSAKLPTWKAGKTTEFKFVNKESFDRLCKPKGRSQQWYQSAVKDALNQSLSLKRILVNGSLSESIPNCIGDPYQDAPKPDSRLLGRNLVCTTTKTGLVGEGTSFEYYPPNCIGDKFPDSKDRMKRRKEAEEKLKKKLKLPADRPVWKPASQKVKRDDQFLSVIDSSMSHTELAALAKEEAAKKTRFLKGEVPVKPRPMYTEPTMGGPVSAWGTLLNHRTEEGRKILSYEYSPYDIPLDMHKAWLKKEREIMGDKRPFSAHVPHGKTFSKDPEVFRDLGPGDGRPIPMRGASRGDGAPFKPTDSVGRDINPLPPFMSDPLIEAKFKRGDGGDGMVRWKPGAVGSGKPFTGTVQLSKRNVEATMRRTYSASKSEMIKRNQARYALLAKSGSEADSKPSSSNPTPRV